MSKFLILLVGIASTSLACPNLSGKYNCNGNVLEVSQVETPQGVVYTTRENGSSFNVIADGKPHSRETEMFKGTVAYSCQNQTLSVIEIGELFEDLTRVGTIESDYKLYLDENSNLVSAGVSEVMYWEEKYNISLDFKCDRL